LALRMAAWTTISHWSTSRIVGQMGDERAPDRGRETDSRTGQSAAAARIHHQTQWVDLQLKQAVERGDFEDLPGFGKPLESIGQDHDPDWWIKQLIEREKITGVLPPALQLRKDDAELDDRLDALTSEREVRAAVDEFNERVRKALYGNPGGPPLITQRRDVEECVRRWRARREQGRTASAEELRPGEGPAATPGRFWPQFFRRRGGHPD
jgi:hypothetical protein